MHVALNDNFNRKNDEQSHFRGNYPTVGEKILHQLVDGLPHDIYIYTRLYHVHCVQ